MSTKKGPITQVTASAAEKADELLAKSTDVYADAKENATAKYSDAKDAVAAQYDAAKAKVTETHKRACVYVKDNPEKSIGIATGVGALIGAIIALIITKRR